MAAVPLSFLTLKQASAPGRTFTQSFTIRTFSRGPNSLKGGLRYSFRSQRYETFFILPSGLRKCQVFLDKYRKHGGIFPGFSMHDSLNYAHPKLGINH